jgi:hypothetical protein
MGLDGLSGKLREGKQALHRDDLHEGKVMVAVRPMGSGGRDDEIDESGQTGCAVQLGKNLCAIPL